MKLKKCSPFKTKTAPISSEIQRHRQELLKQANSNTGMTGNKLMFQYQLGTVKAFTPFPH